jgi:cyclopropane fatty-acyl-phospholipid synthase-like methyltransferase
VLKHLRNRDIKVLMDLGCGYGVLTFIIADFIGAEKVYAVDIDKSRLSILNEVKNRSLVKEVVALPHDFCKPINIDEKVQLVTSFGSLERISCWDDVFENIKKILADQGYLLISVPNLSSWVNRLALLLGYQPRDLEISTKKLYGVAPPFKNMGQQVMLKLQLLRLSKSILIY